MATKKIAAAAPVAAAAAEISPLDTALQLLRDAGKLEAKAGKAKAFAMVQEGDAQSMAIAAMTTPGILSLVFAYDVKDRKGNIVQHVANGKLIDLVAGFTDVETGKESRAKATAFYAAVLPRFFNVTGDNKSVKAMLRQTVPVAVTLVGEGMTAVAGAGGKLEIKGGTGAHAKALREAGAKSVRALKSVAKGEAGKRKPTVPGEKEVAPETKPATLTDILLVARDFLRGAIETDGETEYAPTPADDALIAELAVLAKGYGELFAN